MQQLPDNAQVKEAKKAHLCPRNPPLDGGGYSFANVSKRGSCRSVGAG